MPIYVLKCSECGTVVEALVSQVIHDKKTTTDCGPCGKQTAHVRQPTAGGFKIR